MFTYDCPLNYIDDLRPIPQFNGHTNVHIQGAPQARTKRTTLS